MFYVLEFTASDDPKRRFLSAEGTRDTFTYARQWESHEEIEHVARVVFDQAGVQLRPRKVDHYFFECPDCWHRMKTDHNRSNYTCDQCRERAWMKEHKSLIEKCGIMFHVDDGIIQCDVCGYETTERKPHEVAFDGSTCPDCYRKHWPDALEAINRANVTMVQASGKVRAVKEAAE